VTFSDDIDDDRFDFVYGQLPDVVCAAARPALVAMYDLLRDGGFGPPRRQKYDARAFEDAFFAANPGLGVCPACASAEVKPRTVRAAGFDLDHWFPKSAYPTLAVHPRNLVPLCSTCNGRVKRDVDPLPPAADGRRPRVRTTYLPYRRAAERELDVDFRPEAPAGEPSVLLDGVCPDSSARVRGLDSLFQLQEHWGEHLESTHDLMCEQLAFALEEAPVVDEAVIRTRLLRLARYHQRHERSTPYALLDRRYYEWLATQPLGEVVDQVRSEIDRRYGPST
jgi:hypothetical protein